MAELGAAGDDLKSRRRFLKELGLLMGSQFLGGFSSAFAESLEKPTASPLKYRLAPWQGDDFRRGHELRGGQLPSFPVNSERSVDFVIVGGGLAGLTAAYKLKDANFLLLEQYDEFGGHARGGTYRGIDYSYGAAYIGEIDGIYGELYSSLGISPLKLGEQRNAWLFDGHWLKGVESKDKSLLYKEFGRFLTECKPVWRSLQEEAREAKVGLSPSLAKLDGQRFLDSLTGYGPQFISLLDSFTRSSYCGGLDQVSALAGYYLAEDLVMDTYAFKGGNQEIAHALRTKLKSGGQDRLLSGAFVWKIEMSESGASVIYSTVDGAVHRVNCRHIINSTPPLVAARQFVHFDDALRAQLLFFRYGSYLVANLLLKEKIFSQAYDCFVGAPYSFADFIVAEYPYEKTSQYSKSMGSVLTVYQPYPAGSAGRSLLLLGDRQAFADALLPQLTKLVGEMGGNLEELVLSRWGHAMAIVGPGYFAKTAKIKSLEKGRFSLAHSSLFGGPSAESAIRGGMAAAAKALAAPSI